MITRASYVLPGSPHTPQLCKTLVGKHVGLLKSPNVSVSTRFNIIHNHLTVILIITVNSLRFQRLGLILYIVKWCLNVGAMVKNSLQHLTDRGCMAIETIATPVKLGLRYSHLENIRRILEITGGPCKHVWRLQSHSLLTFRPPPSALFVNIPGFTISPLPHPSSLFCCPYNLCPSFSLPPLSQAPHLSIHVSLPFRLHLSVHLTLPSVFIFYLPWLKCAWSFCVFFTVSCSLILFNNLVPKCYVSEMLPETQMT